MSRERFVELMSDAVVALPQHMKELLRVVEDPEVDDESRVALAGALLHVLSSQNAIPGVRGVLQHVGDVLVLRLVLEGLSTRSPDAFARYREESPDIFEVLSEEMEAARAYLGDRIEVLEKAAETAAKLNHHGHTATECVHDTDASTWLYDTVHEAIIDDLEVDEDEVAREMKLVDRILAQLATRVTK